MFLPMREEFAFGERKLLHKDFKMKTNKLNKLLYLFLVGILCVFCHNQVYGRQKLTVKARGTGKRIRNNDRELLLEFSHQPDEETLTNHISLRDDTGSLEGNYTIELYKGDKSAKTAQLKFTDEFSLKESAKYYVDINKGFRYVQRVGKKGNKHYARIGRKLTFYFVTTSQCPFATSSNNEANGAIERTKLVIVSDIHIGGPRATAGNYNWFKDNISEFNKFLEHIRTSKQVKELIIAGDLFDEWIMPNDVKPFVGSVTNSDEFFQSVAAAFPMKSKVIDKLNEIANAGEIKLIYIPGNHDMLMNESTMKTIFPNAIWKGTKNTNGDDSGTGYYSPADGVSIEHGHLYDFFNAPDPITQTGSLLPPGYFVSRLFATKHQDQRAQNLASSAGNIFFYGAWELVLLKIFKTIEPDIPPIITGIDGYTKDYTYNEARDIYYDAGIGDNWQSRQEINKVYSPESEIASLLAGAGVFIWGDLEYAAWKQYFVPERAKIVVFGHTHMAMLKGYNVSNKAIISEPVSRPRKDILGPTKKIYANSGTWVNKQLLSQGYSTRTYVVINTKQTDSALMTVTLYQYNPDIDDGIDDASVLLDEKNIHPDTDNKQKTWPLIP